jgi:hypothetical protein
MFGAFEGYAPNLNIFHRLAENFPKYGAVWEWGRDMHSNNDTTIVDMVCGEPRLVSAKFRQRRAEERDMF